MCKTIYWYAKADNKYMKNYDKKKESLYLKYWDVNHLYWWAMPQKLPVNKFEWIKETSQFNEWFIKNYDEDGKKVMKDILLKLMFNTQKNYMKFIRTYHLYKKKRKLKKKKSLLQIYMIKTNMSFIQEI